MTAPEPSSEPAGRLFNFRRDVLNGTLTLADAIGVFDRLGLGAAPRRSDSGRRSKIRWARR